MEHNDSSGFIEPNLRSGLSSDAFSQRSYFSYFNAHKSYSFFALLLVVAAVVGFVFYYQKVVLKEEISEFELTPKIADAAGVAPGSTFTLKSSVELSAVVVQKYLQFEPQVEYTVKKISGTGGLFEVAPAAALEENKVYSVKIAEGPIAARAYSWAYQVKAPFQVIATLPRNKSNGIPIKTGIEITFNREDFINPGNSVEIFPFVRGRFETHRNILVFVPAEELASKTVYTVKIKSDIKIRGSADTLSGDTVIKFETGEKYNNEPRHYFSFEKTFWEFKPGMENSFEINYFNLPSNTISLAVYKFADLQEFIDAYKKSVNQENVWTAHHAYNPVVLSPDKKVFESGVPVQEQAGVRFLRMPQKLGEGFYLIDAVVGGEHDYAWAQVSPIASFSAVSGSKTLLWFKDLGNGVNISYADVAFEGGDMGKTNGDGVAIFDTPAQMIRDKNDTGYYYSAPLSYFYIVRSGNRQIAVPIANEFGRFSKVNPPNSWWNYFSLDKTVYLPSDKLHFWGIVKQRNGADVKGEEVTVALTNSYWEGTSEEDITVYSETKAVIGDFYTLTGEIAFSGLKPGYYQLNVKRGDEVVTSQGVYVEAYIKPAYKLILTPDKNAVFAGDAITYRAKANFFDGTAVANMKIKYNGYFNRRFSGEVALNQDGEGSFVIKTDYQVSENKYWPVYLGVNISPAVSEEGEIDANASVLVFGPRIELRAEQSFGDKISKFNLKLRNIVPDKTKNGEFWWDSRSYLGDPVSGSEINADVSEVIYKKTKTGTGYDIINKVTYPIYSYSTEYHPVTHEVFVTDGAGNAHYEWTPEEKKTYRIIFTAKDSGGRPVTQERYVYGGSFSYFGDYDVRGVTLKNLSNKEQYKTGDPISLQMQDFGGTVLEPGSGKFIFIRIINGISSYQITDSPDYHDSFNDSYVPNVGIAGVWFNGSRFRNTYPLNLSFDSDERRLHIEVNKNKDRYKPRDKVDLRIRVTDKNGSPQRAEVNVSGIDEAVFSLNPEEHDITNDLYQDIFSPLVTRSSHFAPLDSGAEMGGCFVAGTRILTPDGSPAIEKLKIGDEVLTREGDFSPNFIRAKIKKVSSHLADGYFVINNNLKITANHRLLVNGVWKHAGELEIGDMLLTKTGVQEKVVSLNFVPEWGLVYNIELESLHTFFAGGIYVHNEEKGGGGARADFREIAIYKSVYTDSGGIAEVSFDAPDDITSWRITTQAVTKDLFAGKNITSVPVGLPFFVETSINRTYLAGDNLILRARVFGTADVSGSVIYTVESETLPFKKIEKTSGRIVEIPLGNLLAGAHRLKISAKSGGYSDAIIRDLTVVHSYFTRNASDFYELSQNLSRINGGLRGYTALLFSSYERGRFYPVLRALACGCGVRIDQKLSRWFAENYLNRFFGEKNEIGNADIGNYQTSDGGIALLPYSDKDLALSAKFANLASDENSGIDSASLRQYLASSLNDRQADLGRTVLALYGLSASREPILITLQNIKAERNLTLTDKIYIALAFSNLGAKEEARNYYRKEIKPTLTTKLPFVFVDKLKNSDDNILATALLAGLAADLAEPEAEGLGQYAVENYPKETLANFEILLYLKNILPGLRDSAVSFSYDTPATHNSITLKNGETFRLELSPEDLAALKFSGITGKIGVSSTYEKESDPSGVKKDNTISVSRRYSVDGIQTAEFKEGDLVRVDIVPGIAQGALEGAYQVVDYLPSGLRAVTSMQRAPVNSNYENYHHYPSDIEDQKVTFLVWKNYIRQLFYYARVVSKGEYKAEPALIQSLKSSASTNISGENSISIP